MSQRVAHRASRPKLCETPPRGPGSDGLTAYNGQEDREIRVEAVERGRHTGDPVLAVRELGQAEETKVVAPEPSLRALSASGNGDGRRSMVGAPLDATRRGMGGLTSLR